MVANPRLLAVTLVLGGFAAPACDKAVASTAGADSLVAPGSHDNTSPGVVAVPPATHVDGNNFKVDTKVPDCTAGSDCAATIRLEALGSYHINDTYPYKFTVSGADGGMPAPGLEFLGKDPTNKAVFSKNGGDFERQGEKVGVLAVRFRAPKGKVAFAGRFKLSVCSEANCQLEQADVSFEGNAN